MCEGDSVRSGVYIATKGEQRAYKLRHGISSRVALHTTCSFRTWVPDLYNYRGWPFVRGSTWQIPNYDGFYYIPGKVL